ncbi:MAG: radical SAM protein [Phycisphaerae bacterium]|nr:radical SAM protein [Phycisphaerae bacterium]
MVRCASRPSPTLDGIPVRDALRSVPSVTSESIGEYGRRIEDLDWIDEFVPRIRLYVRVRLEDGVLIKMPTEVFKLNPGGVRILDRAMRGERIRDIAVSLGAEGSPERLFQIHAFFCDVRDLLGRRLGDGRGRTATEVTRFDGSFTRWPVLSEIAVTYRCNLACTFCYAGCGTKDARPGSPGRERHQRWWVPWAQWSEARRLKRDPIADEMTAEEVMQVIDQIAEVGQVPSVSFTGGECTLRPELPSFIARAHAHGMRVNIITNGVRCEDRAYVDSLAEAGLTSAQVSLEGPDAHVHDRLTQHPGSFDRTVRGIETLGEAGLHVHTNTTICDDNAEHLTGIIDLAKSLDMPHLSMNHAIPTGSLNLRRYRRSRITYDRIGTYVLGAKRHAERVGIGFHWYSPTPFCIFNTVAQGLGNKGCAACDGLLHVSPSGEVLPCSSFSRGVGNLLEQGIEDVWFGKEARYYKTKRQAPLPCRLCADFKLCQGACTLYWSSMGKGELIRAIMRQVRNRVRQPTGLASAPVSKEAHP